MKKLAKWISKNWKEIWGYGTYLESEKDGFYVVVPLKLLCEELGVSEDYLMYGRGEEE